jgi:hypothetical protein
MTVEQCRGQQLRQGQPSEQEHLPSSSDLLLIAHDEWKRREERKHQHDHISWVNGWISGFLTSKKFAQERIEYLHKQEPK